MTYMLIPNEYNEQLTNGAEHSNFNFIDKQISYYTTFCNGYEIITNGLS